MRQTFQDNTVGELSQKLYLVLSKNPFWENQDNANEKCLQNGSKVKCWHNFFFPPCFYRRPYKVYCCAGHHNER